MSFKPPATGLSKLAPGLEASLVSEVPLGCMGDKQDIALACLFLASPAAKYVSGATLVVDGAASLWRTQPVPRESVTRMSRGVEATSRAVGLPIGQPPASKL
jgi:peroxisomal 2,4-dienoyl-CoA reductase